MEFGWLLHGATGLVGPMPTWLRDFGPVGPVLLGGVIVIVLAIAALLRRRRRHVEQVLLAKQVVDEATLLKARLRQRLSEPASLFANANAAPTMGACEAFEGDIEAAARTILVEAGGHRSKAKQILRRKMNGHGALAGTLNGSEVGYWRQLGALSLLDSVSDALPAYVRAADLAPENAEAQMLAGVLYLRLGNLGAAEAAFRRQIELGKVGNGSADAGLARYRGHTMLGDVLAARDEHDQAAAAYALAQREVKGLLERDDEHVGLKRDLSVTYDRIGDMHAAKSEVDAALENYRSSLQIAEALVARDPQNVVWQHDLSVSYDRIGDLLDKKGDRELALECFNKSLAIVKALTLRDPENVQWQWDLSASHDRIGDALIAQGKLADALVSYRRGLEIAETLARRDPGHAGWQRDLAVSYHKIGSLEAIGNPSEARELLEKGRAIIDRLAQIAAHQAQWRSDLSRFDEVLKTLDG
jgi:tetratricopeptide (TPR) repeat protein